MKERKKSSKRVFFLYYKLMLTYLYIIYFAGLEDFLKVQSSTVLHLQHFAVAVVCTTNVSSIINMLSDTIHSQEVQLPCFYFLK